MTAFNVSSYFQLQAFAKTPDVVRQFTMGDSDYSSRVLRWPKFKKKWNDIRPTLLTIGLANEDQLFNFLKDDPTTFKNSSQVKIGFAHPSENWFGHSELYETSVTSWQNTGVDSLATNAILSPMLTKTASTIKFTNNDNRRLRYRWNTGNGILPSSTDFNYSIYARFLETDPSSDTQIHLQAGGLGITAAISDIGVDITTEWQRFELDFGTIADASSSWIRFRADSYTGLIGIWGAQLRRSGVAPDYVMTDGSTHASGDNELLTLYSGTVQRVKYRRGAIDISLQDKIKTFTEQVVGNSDEPVDFTTSNYSPSDIAWFLCTSFGGLSAVESISNPDIDYESFQTWAAVFSLDLVTVNARYEGMNINQALRTIGRYTGSTINVENDKVTFERFSAVSSLSTSLGEQVKDVVLMVDDALIVNRHHTYGDYNISSDTWAIDAIATDSASVNSYGLREKVEKDKALWYVDSVAAKGFSERQLGISGSPYDQFEIELPLNALPRQLGETITFVDSFFGEDGTNAYRIMETRIDTDKGEMQITVDDSQSHFAFILDDATFGVLDTGPGRLL